MTPPHAGVHVVQYVPQSQVLPHVDAVVSHGGAGTTAGALHGTPLLVVPGVAPSQQACAQRVASAGVGLWLDWADATPEALRRAVADLVARDDLRTAASAARSDLEALPPVVDVVAGEAGSVSPSDRAPRLPAAGARG